MSLDDFDIDGDGPCLHVANEIRAEYEASDCPEVRAADLEHQVDDLPRSRWLRRNRAYAAALDAVEDATARGIWHEQTHSDDCPGMYVIEEEVEAAEAALTTLTVQLSDLIAAILEAERLLDVAVAAIELRASLHLPETLDFDRGPPGHIVATSPLGPNGPPLHCVAISNDDVMAAAA